MAGEDREERAPERPVELVVIGGSAGGIEALGPLLEALPADAPAAVVVVLHVPADQPSLLPRIFRRRCRARLCEAEDKAPLTPGTVVFAPPGYHLLIERDGRLALSVDAPVQYARPSIDVLFESAARAHGAGVLAILLSGANEDGARGLGAVRRAGGRVWVQAPETAVADTMPRAGIREAGAERVEEPTSLARALADALGDSGRWS